MIRRSQEHRAKVRELRAQIKALEAPDREAAKIQRARARQVRVKAIGKPAQGQRQPRVREPQYLAFIRRLPCIAGLVEGGCSGRMEAAHVRFADASVGRRDPGLQRKPDDSWSLPSCHSHHQCDQHRQNERAYWQRIGVDPNALCLALHAAYETGADPLPIIHRFAAEARQRRAA